MRRIKTGHFFGILLLLFTVFYLVRTWYYYEVTRTDVQKIIYQNLRNTLLEAQDRIKEELGRDNPHYSVMRNLITRLENNNDTIDRLSFVQDNTVVFSSDPRTIGTRFDPKKSLSVLDVNSDMIFDIPILHFGNTYYKDKHRYTFYVVAHLSEAFSQHLFHEKMKHFLIFSGVVPTLLILFIWWVLRRMIILPLEELERMIKKREITTQPHSLLKEINDLGAILKETFEQLKKQISALDYMARYDMLTGLPNRHYMQEHIDKLIQNREVRHFSLLYLDLDQFKQINDTEGHDVGDIILSTVSERLNALLEKGDTVGRIGGDEFLYCTLQTDEQSLDALTKKISAALSEPFIHHAKEYHLGVSIGIARFPEDGQNRITLIKHADIALYEAKHQGRNRAIFFDDALAQALMKEAKLTREMESSLKSGDFTLYYQPQVSIESGRIIGLEALLRWRHPEYGMVSPDTFIPIAEKNGFILELGHYVLERACQSLQSFKKQGIEISISVNLSTMQIRKELLDEIGTLIKKYGIDKAKLHLEITETVLMENLDENVKTLHALHDAGYQISLDDFGTGYSSLAYLRMMPVHILKIDKSFVMQLGSQKDARALVEGIIALGHALDLYVIAEGVESEDNLLFLQECRCDSYQGYYFSPPVPLEEIMTRYF